MGEKMLLLLLLALLPRAAPGYKCSMAGGGERRGDQRNRKRKR